MTFSLPSTHRVHSYRIFLDDNRLVRPSNLENCLAAAHPKFWSRQSNLLRSAKAHPNSKPFWCIYHISHFYSTWMKPAPGPWARIGILMCNRILGVSIGMDYQRPTLSNDVALGFAYTEFILFFHHKSQTLVSDVHSKTCLVSLKPWFHRMNDIKSEW